MHLEYPVGAPHWRGAFTLLAAFLLTITACAPRTTAPAPDVAAGAVDGTGYRFLRWKQGLAILIWYDFRGDSASSSTSSGGGLGARPTYTVEGHAKSADGRRLEWRVETTDGRTASFRLNGEPYEVSRGTLFIVRMEDGDADVTRLERDLSRVEPNHASIVAFARGDPDLAPLVGQAPSPAGESPSPTPSSIPAPESPAPTPDANTYRGEEGGFALRYPPEVESGLPCPIEAIVDEPLVTFRLTGTEYYSGTNLLDACVAIRVDDNQAARETCLRARDDHEDFLGEEQINGIPFAKIGRSGVAAGHIYDVTSYRTVHADACHEITLLIHTANIGVYEPGTVAEFDEKTVKSKLSTILHTFRFLP